MSKNAAFQEYVDMAGSRREVCRQLGISEALVGHILHGRRNVTPSLALKIEEATGGQIRKEKLVWPDVAA
jgi:DNA-binding transcriptional regulator YdaS (Cro superfamily)